MQELLKPKAGWEVRSRRFLRLRATNKYVVADTEYNDTIKHQFLPQARRLFSYTNEEFGVF
jgi:hypothetical protein